MIVTKKCLFCNSLVTIQMNHHPLARVYVLVLSSGVEVNL